MKDLETKKIEKKRRFKRKNKDEERKEKSRFEFLKTLNYYRLTAFVFTLLFFAAGTIVSVLRFWQYEAFYYDFGIFDQAIWEVAHFQAPVIDHFVVGGKLIFADHFSPGIFLLSPLYWIFSGQETTLVIQAAAVAASGYVLYLIGEEVLKNRLLNLSVLASYFLYVGLQNAVITDFHEITVATFPFMVTYLFALKKKTLWFFISLILLLSFKESLFLVGIGIAISLLILDRTRWRYWLAAIGISVVWGFVSIKILIPIFSGGIYQYTPEIANPTVFVTSLYDSSIKLKTILYTLWSFSFLPLFSPAFYFLIYQDLLTRFYSVQWFTRWDLGFHYNALLAGISGISSLYSLQFLSRYFKRTIIQNSVAVILMINALFLYRVVLHGPFALSYNKAFYSHTSDFTFLNRAIKHVPKDAFVMTQNNLASHFTHQKVLLLRSNYFVYKPQYILLDARPGQNPNDFLGIKNFDYVGVLKRLQHDKNYKQVYQDGDVHIFRKK